MLYMGTSNCLNQIAITVVQIVLNHSLTYYGALSVIVGISQGVQLPL